MKQAVNCSFVGNRCLDFSFLWVWCVHTLSRTLNLSFFSRPWLLIFLECLVYWCWYLYIYYLFGVICRTYQMFIVGAIGSHKTYRRHFPLLPSAFLLYCLCPFLLSLALPLFKQLLNHRNPHLVPIRFRRCLIWFFNSTCPLTGYQTHILTLLFIAFVWCIARLSWLSLNYRGAESRWELLGLVALLADG